MIRREDVVRAARQWLGTRWHHQAAVRGVGTDCVGLVGGVAVELGIPGAAEWAADSALHCYGRDPDPVALVAALERFMDPVDVARPGDVLLLRIKTEPQHFGIVSNDAPLMMLHAYAQARKVVESRVDELWRSRIVGVYAYRGVA